MSSSTSRYQVEENRRRRQRAVAQARQQVERVRNELAELRDAVARAAQDHGVDAGKVALSEPEAPTSDEDAVGHQRHLVALQGILARGRQNLDALVRAARAGEMLATLAATFDDTVAVEVTAPSERADPLTSEREERSQLAARLLCRLEGPVDQARREDIDSLAREMVTSTPNRSAGLEMELRRLVQLANEEAAAVERDQVEARVLRAELLGLNDDRVDEVDAQLRAVESGDRQLSASLRRRVETIRNAVSAEDDRRYAASTTVAVLERLGYEVEEGFETAFVEDGTVYFQRGNWGNYVIRLRVDADESRLDFDMLRLDEDSDGETSDAVRDREMEQTWCDAVPELVGELADEGVHLAVDQRPPRPGRLRTVTRDRVGLRGSAGRRARGTRRSRRRSST